MGQQIKVYTSDDCAECDELLAFLNDAGISYELKNISDNNKYLEDLQQDNIYLTPAVIINRNCRIIGFQKDKLTQLLGV